MSTRERTLSIGELAAACGLPQATIRTWERRYGFPEAVREASGRRRYPPTAVERVRRVLTMRDQGLALEAAIARVRATGEQAAAETPHEALVRAGHGLTPLTCRKRTMVALSRAIEDECALRMRGGLLFGLFQRRRFFVASRARWRDLAGVVDACVVFADFARLRADRLLEVPLPDTEPASREWVIVAVSPPFSLAFCARELAASPAAVADHQRRFEAFWTTQPQAVLAAARSCLGLVARAGVAERAARLERWLDPDALDPVGEETVVAVANRMVVYAAEGVSEQLVAGR